MDECQVAWLAGIVEGEGYITLVRTKSGYPSAAYIKVAMSDEDVVRRIHKLTDTGSVCTSQPYGRGKKIIYVWQSARKDAVPALLRRLQPWMGKRRRKAIDVALGGARPYGYNGNRPRGERNHQSTITEVQVIALRQRYAKGGISQIELAKDFGLGQSTVSRVLLGKTWAHVGGPLKT